MGYHRAEILGALASIFFIWGLLVWLNIEATNRIITPPDDIDSTVMLVTAIIGFVCNVINYAALNSSCGVNATQIEEGGR
jgi:zinc transporter 2